MSITEQIRQAIVNSDQTRYRIALETGVDQGILSRFVHGAELRSRNIDRLADYFGLELRPKPRRKRTSREAS